MESLVTVWYVVVEREMESMRVIEQGIKSVRILEKMSFRATIGTGFTLNI